MQFFKNYTGQYKRNKTNDEKKFEHESHGAIIDISFETTQ